MREKSLCFIVTAITVLAIIGCGSSNNTLSETETNGTDGATTEISNENESNDKASLADFSLNPESEAETTESASSITINEESSDVVGDTSAKDSAEVSAESNSSAGYSSEDIKRLFINYMQSISPNFDASALDIDISFTEGFYWVETFKENETDSMHPVKSGSARIDPVTGIGKFWTWAGTMIRMLWKLIFQSTIIHLNHRQK